MVRFPAEALDTGAASVEKTALDAADELQAGSVETMRAALTILRLTLRCCTCADWLLVADDASAIGGAEPRSADRPNQQRRVGPPTRSPSRRPRPEVTSVHQPNRLSRRSSSDSRRSHVADPRREARSRVPTTLGTGPIAERSLSWIDEVACAAARPRPIRAHVAARDLDADRRSVRRRVRIELVARECDEVFDGCCINGALDGCSSDHAAQRRKCDDGSSDHDTADRWKSQPTDTGHPRAGTRR